MSQRFLPFWHGPTLQRLQQVPIRVYLLIVAGLIALQAIVLFSFGQPAICTCGGVRFWVGTVLGPENSQQLTDWYSFSHVIHGIAFMSCSG